MLYNEIKKEVYRLHYPSRERVIRGTWITFAASVILSAIITADTTLVTKIVEKILDIM